MSDVETVSSPDVAVIPIPIEGTVSLGGTVGTREEAADYGSYMHYSLVTGNEPAQRILSRDESRQVAWIWVSAGGPVWIGSEAQGSAVDAGNTAGAGISLQLGLMLPVTHKQEVWLHGSGAAATVNVANYRNQKPEHRS